MSSFTKLQHDLNHYWQLPCHNNPMLADKLKQVQSWQRKRINQTHAQLFSQPQNQAMARYFVHDLYGGEDFQLIAKQLEIILPKAQKIEKLIPTKAIETGSLGIQAAIEAIELDLQIAEWLLAQALPVNRDNMLVAYHKADAEQQRQHQIATMQQVCYATDKYINSFILQKSFKLAKTVAYSQGLQPLYDFIADGFDAMSQLDSIASFIEPVAQKELFIIQQVHTLQNLKNNLINNDTKIDPFFVSL